MGEDAWGQRWHPLRREWVIVAAHRQDRPWVGETVERTEENLPAYVEDCPLCPGNRRVSGAVNDDYESIFVFDNDLPCVEDAAPAPPAPRAGIHECRPARGAARVVCYSPLHNVTLCELPVEQVDALLGVWQQQYRELGARDDIKHVLVFENKGAAVGVSNPHPHGQIYATNFVFRTMEIETEACREHAGRTGRALLADVLDAERADGRRIVCANDGATAFVPYFARYAYEVFVAPHETRRSLADLGDGERRGFADVLRRTLIRLDNLWHMPMPYVMALHQAPTDGGAHPGFHFHVEIHPPLRKPDLRKHLAGPEIGGGNFLNDIAPERAAAELQAVGDVHYKHRLPGADDVEC